MKAARDLRVLQSNSDPPHQDGQRPSLRGAGEGSTSRGGNFFSSNESKQCTSLALLPIDEKSLISLNQEPSRRGGDLWQVLPEGLRVALLARALRLPSMGQFA